MPLTRDQHYDVVIVGAGLVGASLAIALAQDPSAVRVLLVEASPIETATATQPGFDARSTVLSAGTVFALEELGLWDKLRPSAEPILQIQVSDQGHFGTVRLDSSSEGVAALGYVLENATLGSVLNAALLAAAALEVCAPAEVLSIRPAAEGMRLQLRQGASSAEITGALVVLAEGGRSGLCAQLGITHTTRSYQQTAIIANVAFTKPHEQAAWERFTPKGPLALLPLASREARNRAALIWTHPADAVANILALDDSAFLIRLQQDFGQRVGSFIRVGKRALYPLALQMADEQIRPGLVLLGNVAHALHPVAGQGFNLAFRDTMTLVANIRASLQQQVSPGTFTRLQAYLEAVRQDQQHTIGFSDYMTRVFSSSNIALALLRKFGMASIDLLPPLKHQLSRQAMGLAQPRAPQ